MLQNRSKLQKQPSTLLGPKMQPIRRSSFLAYLVFFAVIGAVLYAGYYYNNKQTADLTGQSYKAEYQTAEDGSEIVTMYNICKEVGCFDPNLREKHPICDTRNCLQYE